MKLKEITTKKNGNLIEIIIVKCVNVYIKVKAIELDNSFKF